MRALLTLAVVIAAALAGAPGRATAGEAAPEPVSSYCSESGDLCFGVVRRSGAVHLELTTYARYFGRYRLCVAPPRGRQTCRTFPVRRRGGLWGSSVRWYRTFPSAGPGVYRATWKLGTARLGPTLRFRVPVR